MDLEIFLVYGITDCPACLRACADLMEQNRQYVFIETDFSADYRKFIKKLFEWDSFPVIVRTSSDGDTLIGGYTELKDLLGKCPPAPD